MNKVSIVKKQFMPKVIITLIEYVCEEGEVGYIGNTGIPKHSKLKNIWLVNKKILLGIDKIGFNVRIKNWIYIRSINGDEI